MPQFTAIYSRVPQKMNFAPREDNVIWCKENLPHRKLVSIAVAEIQLFEWGGQGPSIF